MDNPDRKYLELVQRSHMLATKASLTVSLAGVIQELLNMNQQLGNAVSELVETSKNEHKSKGIDADDSQVPGKARAAAE